jgi:hypothetical protein
MRDRIRSSAVLLLVGFLAAPLSAADKGRLTGTVDKPELVSAVSAKDRLSDEADKVYKGKLDAKTGAFVIDDLPLDATYDVIIDLTGGGRLEGVNLKVAQSDFAAAGEDEQPMTKEDVEALKKSALALNKFEDKIEILTISGNCQHAAVLLNKTRTQPFIGSKEGEMIWRLELWHYEKPGETWVKDQDELFITMYRERLPKADFAKKDLTLDPLLGGHRLTAKEPTRDLGTVKLPGKEPGVRLRSDKASAKR